MKRTHARLAPRILVVAVAVWAAFDLSALAQPAQNPIRVSLSGPRSVVEGTVRPGHPEDEPKTVVLTVRLSRPAGVEVNVCFGWVLTADKDTPPGKVSLDDVGVRNQCVYGLKAGETKGTLVVGIAGDDRPEPNETFEIALFNVHPLNPADFGGEAFTLTIIDDDGKRPPPGEQPAAEPALAIAGVQELEGDAGGKRFAFTVTLSARSTETVTVGYRTEPFRSSELGELGGRLDRAVSPKRSAEAGTDYIPLRGLLSFRPGETSKEIVVTVAGDVRPEPDEAFVVALADPQQARLAVFAGAALGTILDDDAERELRVFGASGEEGDTAGRRFVFRVTLASEKPTSQPVEVGYRTRDDEAKAGKDYQPLQGRLTFRPGEQTKEIAVTVVGDRVFEPKVESFAVELLQATNATIASGPGQGTIEDDDGGISIAAGSAAEGFGGLIFEVRLKQPTDATLSVPFRTEDGTATAGKDYQATRGQLVFRPGQTTRTIDVEILDDRVREPKEAFTVVLTPPAKWFGFAYPTGVTGTGTIRDDD